MTKEEIQQGKPLLSSFSSLISFYESSRSHVYPIMWVNGSDKIVKAMNTSLCIVKKKGLKILFSSPLCLAMCSFMEEPHDEWLCLVNN